MQPVLFISHGAPSMLIEGGETAPFLQRLGQELQRPDAILCVSAHWISDQPLLSAAEQPETIHDFYGFPDVLYDMEYPAPGAPALAEQAAGLLRGAGVPVDIHPRRGLDHGCWTPLKLMFPGADVPVTQLSIQMQRSGTEHLRMGEALRPLREGNVLILGSGSATHNLRGLRPALHAPVPAYVHEFDQWLEQAVTAGDTQALAEPESAPHFRTNHPTPDHYLPLPTVLGAASDPRGELMHREFTYGSLSLACYRWT